MSKIEIDGFLAEETTEGKKIIIEAYADFFAFARDLNKYCMKILRARKVDWEDRRKLIIEALFIRSVELFQSVFLMLEMGLMPSAKVLARAILEIVFTLVAIQKKPELLEFYFNQHEKSHFYNLKSMISSKSKHLRKAVKEHGLEKKYIEMKKEMKLKEIEVLGPKEWAKAAELEDLYVVYYNIYSDSIHCNPSALDDHVDNEPESVDLSFGPSDTDLFDVLKCCIYCILNSANSSALAHGENIEKELDRYANKISFFDQKYIQN